MADATSGTIQSGRIFADRRTTGLEPLGRDFFLGLLGVGGAVPGGMADSDLEAREQQIADYPFVLETIPYPLGAIFFWIVGRGLKLSLDLRKGG